MTSKRQILVYFPHELKVGTRALPVDVPGETQRPSRIWTLFRHLDPAVRPELPFMPVHNRTAFLEDFVHDWNWVEGKDFTGPRLRYYSRVVPGHVWLLLEYDEEGAAA